MNRDETMAESNGDFVGLICGVFDPVARIADRLLHVRGDPVSVDADISGTRSIVPRPTPHVAKHTSVKFSQKPMIEYVAFASVGPIQRRADIDLFGFIQFVS